MRLDEFFTSTFYGRDKKQEEDFDAKPMSAIQHELIKHANRPFSRNGKGVITIDFGNFVMDLKSKQSSHRLTGSVRSDVSSSRQHFHQLDLDMSGQDITDINTLSNLNRFSHINLGYNQIDDITPIGHLTQLVRLRLNNNHIKDITAMSGLTRLELANLGNNDITDISALSSLSRLKVLVLSDI